MSYEAHANASGPHWHVDGDYSAIIANRFSEAEAKIIAFALNAVLDGGRLEVAHLGWPEPTIIPYTGPSLTRAKAS